MREAEGEIAVTETPQRYASVAFSLLIVGTLGLMLNEYVLHWGTVATIVFAVANAIGLAILGVVYMKTRKNPDPS